MAKQIEVDFNKLAEVVDLTAFLEYYKKRFNSTWPLAMIGLNEKEEAYIKEHPLYGIAAGHMAMIAMEEAGPGVDDENDALRHCYWAAMMTKALGEAEARVILNNHEGEMRNPMDDHNNEVGIAIGRHPELNDTIISACKAAAKAGKLQTTLTVDPPKTTTFTTRIGTATATVTKKDGTGGSKAGGKAAGKNDGGGRSDGGAADARGEGRGAGRDRGGNDAKPDKGGNDAKPDKGGNDAKPDKGGGGGLIGGRPGLA